MYFTEAHDYRMSSQQTKVIFPPGKTRASFVVDIINDRWAEHNETFRIIIDNFSLPYGVNFGSHSVSSAVAVILDDDSKHN